MINKLTGESVSKETLETIEHLMRGKNVNMETIDNLKEIKEGYSHLSQGDSTHLLKNREKIQNEVLNRLQNQGSAVTKSDGTVSFNGDIICEKRLDIVIGLPAAGKSSALANPISELCQSRIIDNDDAKKELPEYDNGWGAGVVHEESQQISQMQFDKSLNKGENIVYPKVGGNLKKLTATIEEAKRQGYKVYVHFNDLNQNKALGRMMKRFLETGRFINPKLITRYGNSIENTYQALKNSSLIDGFSKWSNDVPLGHRPKLIECSNSCKKMCNALKPSILEQLEKFKAICSALIEKIMEVKEVLRKNPKLSAEYVKARDELRQEKKGKEIVKGENKQKHNKPKK